VVVSSEAASEALPPPWWSKPLKNPWLVAFVIGALTLTVLPFIQRLSLRAPPPVLSLGPWQLIDQWGKPIGSDTLEGTVWVASFFFTRCPSVCPKQQQEMKKLLAHVDDLDGKIKLVSFTVDPDYDRPAQLNAYAKKLGADAALWSFVGGDPSAMRDLVVGKFKLAMGDKTPASGHAVSAQDDSAIFDIAHAAKFVLVDQRGDVRGFWSTDDEGRGSLVLAARLLAKHGPEP
jgi:protein SCO1/2